MDEVNTTPDGTCQPTPEESSNPTPEGTAFNDSTQAQQVGDIDTTLEPAPKKQRSSVWSEFNRMVEKDGKVKAQCMHCLKKLSGETKNGTNHLHGHLSKCVKRKIKMRAHDKGQTFIMPITTQGKPEIGFGNYDPEVTKKLIANAIIMHDYPLSIVEHVGFRQVLGSLQPLFQVPSRNTIKKEILKIYDIEREVAMKMLDTHEGRVAITTDMWTASNQKKGYMAVTAHYIDGTWTLQSRVLRFIYVPAPHTAERLGRILVDCLMDWNIDTKLSTITLDNCSTNDKMIVEVKSKLQLGSLIRDGSLLHMRCCAHILNLIVKDGLQDVKEGIEKIRDSVVYWSGTPKRKEKFEETAKQLRITCTRSLALDCPTRWNSTFKMLEIAIPYKDVFIRLFQRDSQYHKLMSNGKLPSDEQWQFAKDVCGCLKLFNEITELISGTKYPTANLYFSKICKIRLEIIAWKKSSNQLIHEMAKRMMDKFEIYWNAIHDIMGVATVLDPRYKTTLLEFHYAKLYPKDSTAQVQRIRDLCYDLLSDYQHSTNSCENSTLVGSNVAIHDPQEEEFEQYVKRKQVSESSFVKSELDHYLGENVISRTPDFDILNWWKTNGVMYPTLQKIAKDVLAIPITSVASESAFSTGGRILSPHRSRLHWTTVEALMCARSWLWSEHGTMNSSVAQEYATVLKEMDSDDEVELVGNFSSYNIQDD